MESFEIRKLEPPLPEYAVRCLPLGLTAYGDTIEDGEEKLNLMFRKFAHLHIEQLRKYLEENDGTY